MPNPTDRRINNSGSDPNQGMRRSGGSVNDPHGGHEHVDAEWRAPDPDPVHEMVPGGQGAEPPPYSGDDLAGKMADVARGQPGHGPSETDSPTLGRGNPELGPDPARIAPSKDPTSVEERRREGMHEAGIAPSSQPVQR